MTDVIKHADCGNSPKNEFIQDFEAAFGQLDVDKLIDWVTDDIEWVGVGQAEVQGVTAFEDMLLTMSADHIEKYEIEGAISHGLHGCAWGKMTESDGAIYEFCDLFTFENLKAQRIRAIRSFSIQVDSGE
ncbi:MAG TPA: nuclear transport factor 2 family protein [Bellilinea sp.]|nr:nuclear transport factor 2 family protein [Bellilinea sp.]